MTASLATSETAAAKLLARARGMQRTGGAKTDIEIRNASRSFARGVRFCGKGGQ